MLLRFCCSSGHRLKADSRYAGRSAKCPACGETTVIPRPDPSPFLTDTGVVKLLDEDEPLHLSGEQDSPSRPRLATCPRCGSAVSAQARVCSCCNFYLMASEAAWRPNLEMS